MAAGGGRALRNTGMVLCRLALFAALSGSAARAADETLTFSAGCVHGARIVVAAVGDLLFHKKLQVQAYREGADFRKFWAPVAELLHKADILYGNFEAPAAHGVSMRGRDVADPGRRLDGDVYSATLETLSFNVHPSVLDDLAASGFDVLSTANNHAYDRGPLGIDRTIDNLEARDLAFTGTRRREGDTRPWTIITQAEDFTVAWLACTFSTNGPRDRHGQILECYGEREEVLSEISALAGDPSIDAVILAPHWGVENSHKPLERQRDLARDALEEGALAVVGTHPHVVQPWEYHVSEDGREGLIVYSTGNFISNQRRLMERAGTIVFLELVRDESGRVRLGAAGYVPTWVVIDGRGHRVTVNEGRSGWPQAALYETRRLLPLGNETDAGERWPPDLALDCRSGEQPIPRQPED